jgi:uncharacterized protein involved in exopolysaccharide biosynthesis
LIRRDAPRVLLATLVAGGLAYGVASLLPRWYQAETTLMPPDENSAGFGLLASMIESSALSKVGLITSASAADVFEVILNSRRVREPLIERYALRKVYGQKNLDLCLKEMSSHVKVDVLRSHVLVLRVEDQDPKRASDLANDLIGGLERVSSETQVQRASQAGDFLQAQLAAAQRRLRDAENRLSVYERSSGVLAGGEATAVEGVAELMSRKMALQVRRTWMESYAGRENPTLASVTAEISAIDGEIARLPGLKQQASRLALEVEIQRRIYTLLTAQYEETRIDRERTVSGITVLDPARPPTIKSRPRKALVAGVAAAVALVLGGAWVVMRARAEMERAGFLPG